MSAEYESLGSEAAPVTLGIRGRGHSSWEAFDKKPYKIKFDKKQAVLGMPQSKHYALLAHPGDTENTTCALGYKLTELLMDDWNPRFRMVEVVLNGYNIGLYWLTETIRVETTRIDITEQEDLNEDPATISSWIMELDNYEEEETLFIPSASPRLTRQTFTPKVPEILSQAQKTWAHNELKAIDEAINASDVNSTAWEEFIDLEVAAQYIAAQELMGNFDGFCGSTYLWRDTATKWHFGPLWDVGWCLTASDGKGWSFQQRRATLNDKEACWLPELLRFPRLQEALNRQFDKAAAHLAEIEEYANAFHNSMSAAIETDTKIWPEYHSGGFSTTWSHYIKPRFERRLEWLRSPEAFESLTAGIDDVTTDRASVVSSIYFTPAGQRTNHPAAGRLYIRRDTMSDGSVRHTKTVN